MPNEPMTWAWAGWEPAQFYRRLGGFHEQQEGNALTSSRPSGGGTGQRRPRLPGRMGP
jgi:hypothetical protein